MFGVPFQKTNQVITSFTVTNYLFLLSIIRIFQSIQKKVYKVRFRIYFRKRHTGAGDGIWCGGNRIDLRAGAGDRRPEAEIKDLFPVSGPGGDGACQHLSLQRDVGTCGYLRERGLESGELRDGGGAWPQRVRAPLRNFILSDFVELRFHSIFGILYIKMAVF